MSEKLLINGLINSFKTHKVLAEKAFRQLDYEGIHWLENLVDSDLSKTKTLRGEQIIIADYIPRVLTHFAYHSGQIVFITKQYLQDKWKPF